MRFPGFTDEWKKTTLGDISVSISSGKSGNPIEDGDYYLYGSTGIIGLTDNGDYDGEKILVARVGANAGRINYNNCRCGITDNTLIIRIKEYSTKFIYFHLIHSNLNRLVFGSGQPLITGGMLKKLSIGLPSSKECDKIVSLLNCIEERIATQNKIIEDLKKLKSAIIDKLYVEATGEEYHYSELFTVVTERNTNLLYSKVIAASQEYGMVERDYLNLNVQFDESAIHTYKIIHPGDYVIHLRSFQGGYAFSRLKGICSPAYVILRPHESVEYGYFEHYFNSTKFVNSLRLVTYGIRDGRSINVDEWMSMKVVLPSNEEQDKIIRTIQSIDSKLENEKKIFTLLSQQRQFLLRQLFI